MKTVLALVLALSLPAQVTLAADGPRCTIEYPRGFKVVKGTKKRPLSICRGGDLSTTWRNCTSRYSA